MTARKVAGRGRGLAVSTSSRSSTILGRAAMAAAAADARFVFPDEKSVGPRLDQRVIDLALDLRLQ